MSVDWRRLAGQLLLVGFEGTSAPESLLQRISEGEVGGVILFSRNIANPLQVAELVQSLRTAAPPDCPLLVGVDQEGGRVQRLGPPLACWPAMRLLAAENDLQLTRAVGRALGADLQALGFNLDFAPVLDVVSSAANEVIGDRSFGASAEVVIAHGLSLARGLKESGVLPCGKHFPGHGGEVADSHLTLPCDPRPAAALFELDLQPFAAAAEAGVPLLMTAHVCYPALDPQWPATLSRIICTELLREQLGFDGVLVSDDLEMGAIAGQRSPVQAAQQALLAGVDLLLLCHEERLQRETLAALVAAAQAEGALQDRLEEAAARVMTLKEGLPAVPETLDAQTLLARVQSSVHADLLARLA